MTPRSIRRAAERKAQKLARKATQPSAQISDAQLAANRANAQLSTGPITKAGKAHSSLNAVKTGLTGRTVLLPSDDAGLYEQHLRDYFAEFRPVGPREVELVQSIADTAWRLRRIPELEMGIYAFGHAEQIEYHEAVGENAPNTHLFELQTFLKYEKQLRNLQLQESRLRRNREKDMSELRAIQQERQTREKEERPTASTAPQQRLNAPAAPTPTNGFVFSTIIQPGHEAAANLQTPSPEMRKQQIAA